MSRCFNHDDSAKTGLSHVAIPWGASGAFDVPAVWLRDNCPCPACRVEATTEKRNLISQVPLGVAPLSVSRPDAETLVVDWGEHQSCYTRSWFDSLASNSFRRPSPKIWSGGHRLTTFEAAQFDSEDGSTTGALELIHTLATQGAALVRGVPSEPGESDRFISRWVPVREVAFGRVHDVFSNPAGYNIAHTSEALPPHNDMASYANPPSGQIIHMLVNESTGGESTLVDGWNIVEQLTEDEREVLASVSVPFRQFDSSIETWARRPLLRFDDWGNPIHFRYSNQLMQTLEPDHPRLGEFYQAYHRLTELLLTPDNQAVFRLDTGDLMLLDNHRVLHGRRAFRPQTGARHLQDVYFELEDLINHGEVLANRT